MRVSNFEKQITSLKKRLAAQHRLRREREIQYAKLLERLSESRKYANSCERTMAQLERDRRNLQLQVDSLKNPWSQVVAAIRQYVQPRKWRDFVLDWYAVLRLSAARKRAIQQAWPNDDAKLRKVAWRYWAWDRNEGKIDTMTTVYYVQGKRIDNGTSQKIIRSKARIARLLQRIQIQARKIAARVTERLQPAIDGCESGCAGESQGCGPERESVPAGVEKKRRVAAKRVRSAK